MTIRLILCLLSIPLLARAADPIDRQTLFAAGQGEYFSYRIPSLLTVNNNTVLAFCEGRRHSGGDSGEINLLLRRSTDSGKTFSPPQVVWADQANTCGNPCPVFDSLTNTIFLLMTHNLGTDREHDIVAGTSKQGRTVWITRSTDAGVSWSAPVDITSSVKKPEWAWYATGPGTGIQLQHGAHAGRLLIPCDYTNLHGGPNSGNSHVIFSDDHGASWRIGGEPPEKHYNESQIVELSDGSVMLNMRNSRYTKSDPPPLGRGVSISHDAGESFDPSHLDPSLPEPVCQGSILRVNNTLYFSNPASSTSRENLTLRSSPDDGKTWPTSQTIWPGPTGYSSLAQLPNGNLALLFEAGDSKSYERIDLVTLPSR